MPFPASPDNAQLATDLHVEATYRLTEALVESENRMRRRVELLSEVVFETDARGAFVFLNDAWTKRLGYSKPDSLGQTLCSFVLGEEKDPICALAMQGTGAAGAPRPRIRLRTADGGVAWMELSTTPLPNGGVVGALHDVTAEKLAQDEVAKLSLVASYTDNLVVITDAEGHTEWVNQAFINRTGYSLEEMIGRKPGHLLQGPETDRTAVDQIRQWRKEGRSFRVELLNYTRTGVPFWGLFQITPIRNAAGVVERFVSIQTDITELRRTRVELEQAKERAEAANEAKTQFLATISHEMRTPLNVILGSTDLALDSETGVEEIQPHLKRITANAEILLRLISDMLDTSKIEAGLFDFERIPVKLRACLQSAVAPIADRARAKGLDFRLMCDEALPAQIMGDPDRLRQIVTNLAENAVKFTDVGTVRVEASRQTTGAGDDMLELRFIDSGLGIAPDAQARIFERFEQGDSSTTRRKGGAGLGLNIVKSIVEALGGHVSLRSVPGEGADFRVVLPLEVATDTAPRVTSEHTLPAAAPARGATRPAAILIAEDTEANFLILEVFLTKAGYTVLRATNGLDAVTAADGADLILMDVEMPEIDGLEATRRIRHAEQLAGRSPVPILALTAHAVQGYRERCMSAGCTGYLSKPIRKQTLLTAVAGALAEAPVSNDTVVTVSADLAHLIPTFLEHCRKEQARLRQAVGKGDWVTAARIGHSLKGAAPSMGFIDVGLIGRIIEEAARAERADHVADALARMEAHLAAVHIVTH